MLPAGSCRQNEDHVSNTLHAIGQAASADSLVHLQKVIDGTQCSAKVQHVAVDMLAALPSEQVFGVFLCCCSLQHQTFCTWESQIHLIQPAGFMDECQFAILMTRLLCVGYGKNTGARRIDTYPSGGSSDASPLLDNILWLKEFCCEMWTTEATAIKIWRWSWLA